MLLKARWRTIIFGTKTQSDKCANHSECQTYSLTIKCIPAFSISEAFMDTYNINVDIKWPNDLYFGEYKFGGILSELKKDGKLQAIILGIGLNVNIDDKTLDGLDNTATSIRKILGREADRELIMAKILDDFERSYNYFSTTGDFKSLFTKWEKNIRYQ